MASQDDSAPVAARPDDGASAQAQRFRDGAEAIRQRTDLTAKTFGGLATTAVSALGIAKFADVFPMPPGEWPWTIGLIGGFVLMLAVVGLFTARLWKVSEPIILRSSAKAMLRKPGGELRDDDEEKIVEDIYNEVAELNRAPSLRAYEARAHRLLRIADRSDDQRAAKLGARASTIIGDILATESRALMIIVRRRATHAVGDKKAMVAYALFIVGIAGFGVSANRLDSERTGSVNIAKACADARTAGAAKLPAICGSPSTPAASTPAAERAQAIKDLGAALGRCEATLPKGTSPDPCAPLQRAFTEAIAP